MKKLRKKFGPHIHVARARATLESNTRARGDEQAIGIYTAYLEGIELDYPHAYCARYR